MAIANMSLQIVRMAIAHMCLWFVWVDGCLKIKIASLILTNKGVLSIQLM